MTHGVIRTDNMLGTDVGTHLVSFKYQPSDTDTAIDNGNVVVIGDLINGEREVHTATTPAANSALAKIAVVASVEVMYDERKKNLDDFYNEAGKICRGYYLHSKDVFSVTADALSIGSGVTPAVGSIVELAAGTKLNVVASLTSGSTQVGTIAAIEKAGRYTYYVIQIA